MNLNTPADIAPAASEKYGELSAALRAAGKCADLPPAIFADLLLQWCSQWAIRELAMRELATQPSVVATANNGTQYPRAQLKVIEGAERTMDRIFRRLLQDKRTGDDGGDDPFSDL